MNEFLQNLLYAVITTVLPILVAYGVRYIKTKRAEKLQNIGNTYVQETIARATDIVIDAVEMVNQTFVDNLKKEGTFDPDKQKEALNKAVKAAKRLLSEEAGTLITEKYNDLDAWIRNTIESFIHSTKVA